MTKYLLLLLISSTVFSTTRVTVEDWEEIHGDGTYTKAQRKQAQKKLALVEKNLGTLEKTAEQSNLAIRAIIKISVRNLKRHGYYNDAKRMEREWEELDGKLIEAVRTRNIGDFEPISEWLALAYEVLEAKLGLDICKALRLTDLKTLNYCLVVVFKPCAYGYSDFYDHFVTDEIYKGLAPVVIYWTTVITCNVASFGAGAFFICSPIGFLVERATLLKLAPWVAPKIYNAACTR